MDTHASAPVQHPLRPYSVSTGAPLDDFSWHSPASSSPARPGPSSTPPSLRYPSEFDAPSALPSAGAVLSGLVTSSLLSFTGVALVQPFEVAKTLCQVQWVPKTGVLDLLDPSHLDDGDDVIQDESEAETYFADLSSVAQPGFAPPGSSPSHLAPPRPTDRAGYLARDELSRPEWVMPVVVQGGVWDMIKTLARWKGEGWRALWKGQLSTFVYDALSTSVQPAFLSLLTLVVSPFSVAPALFTALPLIYSPRPVPLLLLTTLSHALTTFVLSPLDLVRTRLIVQSSQPSHRKYPSNPVRALATIAREEGGFGQQYLHPNLVVPTVLEAVVRPLLHLSIPLVITRYLHVEPSTSPLSFATLELVLSSLSLVLTIPIETVRKRLQLQSRAEFVRAGRAGGVGKPWRSSVELRPTAYTGVFECVWRILTEETGKLPPPRTRRMSRHHSHSHGASAGPGGSSGTGRRPPPPPMNRADSTRSTTSQVIIEDGDDDVVGEEDLKGVGLGGGGSAAGGLRQLYRGLSMGVGANVVVFLLGILAGGGGGVGGASGGSSWAEM